MEQGYLIDTNTVIDYLDNKLPENNAILIEGLNIQISIITRIELLAWPKATTEQMEVLKEFIKGSNIFVLEEPIVLKAIEIRRNFLIKLPDAIIAASALVHNLTLITHNTKDFKSIPDIKLLNSH